MRLSVAATDKTVLIMLFLTIVALCLCTADVRGKIIEPLPIPEGITIFKVIATYEEAQERCASRGAVVASPLTAELLNGMKSVIGENTPYFIGTKSSHFDGCFKSEEGVPLGNMTDALTHMVHQLDPLAGDCLSMDQKSIQTVPCSSRLPFMCYKVRKCPEGYTFYESTGSCYRKYLDLKIWEDAVETCQEAGAHLVVLDDAKEAMVIKDMNIHYYPRTYIGLHFDSGHGGWMTVTGKSVKEVYHVWASGRPTGRSRDEYFCGVMLPSGKIDNYYCLDARKFICEYEL